MMLTRIRRTASALLHRHEFDLDSTDKGELLRWRADDLIAQDVINSGLMKRIKRLEGALSVFEKCFGIAAGERGELRNEVAKIRLLQVPAEVCAILDRIEAVEGDVAELQKPHWEGCAMCTEVHRLTGMVVADESPDADHLVPGGESAADHAQDQSGRLAKSALRERQEKDGDPDRAHAEDFEGW